MIFKFHVITKNDILLLPDVINLLYVVLNKLTASLSCEETSDGE
jgi:hypothetical protein